MSESFAGPDLYASKALVAYTSLTITRTMYVRAAGSSSMAFVPIIALFELSSGWLGTFHSLREVM